MKSHNTQTGVTLIELVVSIVILTIAATGILMVITQSVMSSGNPMIREQATAIAQSYMEEILVQSLVDPDGTTGEASRALYDDVWDYHLLNDASGAIDQSGTPVAGLEGYSISVSVTDSGITLGGSPATRIRVTVAHSSNSVTIPITAYRLN